MAKCKICKKEIPDGTEYCKNCLDKGKNNTNESYLDSLLSSVKNTAPKAESIYKKKDSLNSFNDETNFNEESDLTSTEDMFQADLDDIEDFEQYDLDKELTDLKDDIVISDEDLFGEDLTDILADDTPINTRMNEQSDARLQKTNADKLAQLSVPDAEQQMGLSDSDQLNAASEAEQQEAVTEAEQLKDMPEAGYQEGVSVAEQQEDVLEAEQQKAVTDEVQLKSETDEDQKPATSADSFTEREDTNNNIIPGEINDSEEEEFDSDLNNLLNSLDMIQGNNEKQNEGDEEADAVNNGTLKNNNDSIGEKVPLENKPVSALQQNNTSKNTDYADQDEEDDDILSLLNQIAPEDPVADDVKAISDLMSGKSVEAKKETNSPSDVGEVFSDALTVVTNLNDPSIDEVELLNKTPDKKDKKKKNDKKDKKAKKDKSRKSTKKQRSLSNNEPESDGLTAKPHKSLLKHIFGNVKNENTAKKHAEEEKALLEAAASKEGKKKRKNKKGKKGPLQEQADESQSGEIQGKGENKDLPKKKAESRKEKKEKKRKKKEIIQVIDEIDEDEGRINRLGAAIVFIFFGLLAALLYFGTNMINYTVNIQHASAYFEDKKYTQAYNEVYGVDIKDKDIEIYEKIQTVMFVNKQLNSYNNFNAIKEYPQALDSLLKGLKRYDKYLELATKLGIKSDLDYVRRQLLAELKREFGITEDEALTINRINNNKEYGLEVYEASKNVKSK